jgi:hypothetical protein
VEYSPGQPISVFKENTNWANGITRDMHGRLVACEALTRRLVREEPHGTITMLASSFLRHTPDCGMLILVPLFDLKSLSELAASGVGTSNRRH